MVFHGFCAAAGDANAQTARLSRWTGGSVMSCCCCSCCFESGIMSRALGMHLPVRAREDAVLSVVPVECRCPSYDIDNPGPRCMLRVEEKKEKKSASP